MQENRQLAKLVCVLVEISAIIAASPRICQNLQPLPYLKMRLSCSLPYAHMSAGLSPGYHRDEPLSSRTGETQTAQNLHLKHSQGYVKALSYLHHFSHTRYLRLDKTLIPGHTFRVFPQPEEILL